MAEVLVEANRGTTTPSWLETADYWLSLGILIGLRSTVEAERILALIEEHEQVRTELEEEARGFCEEVLG